MRTDDLRIAYGGKEAVKGVSIPVRRGEVLGLIGPSGCGKTTLLRSLNRLTELTPTATRMGRIFLDDTDVDTIEVTDLRRRVSMVFQQPNPFPMSIFDNVAYALREQGSRRPKKAALMEPVTEALERAGPARRGRRTTSTTRRCGSPAASSSGCASPARSPRDPEVLLLDEPCSALDPQVDADDRGADRAAARGGRDRDRHAQPPAGPPRRRQGRLHVPRATSSSSATATSCSPRPREERTIEYVSGAFG